MKLLLDTSALIWLGSDDSRFGKKSRKLYRDAEEVYFSSVSIFEVSVKRMLKKLDVPDNVSELLGASGLRELPMAVNHALQVERFGSLIRHDMFDRMLLSQAASNDLKFLTSDRVLLGLGQSWILDVGE